MKNKGFTLIELLAVIVILAIIALIATPIVLNIIEDSKNSSKLNSASHYMDAVSYAISVRLLENKGVQNGTYSIMENGNVCLGTIISGVCNDEMMIEIKGEKPNKGTITIENLKSKDINLGYDDEYVVKDESGNFVYGFKKYKNGEIIYYNVTTGQACDESEYTESQSNTGIKEGCMKFYAFNDKVTNETVDAILDHNIVNSVSGWVARSELYENTSSWLGVEEPIDYPNGLTYDEQTISKPYKARLITAEEIAQITGADKYFGRTDTSYYFDEIKGNVANETNRSDYGWLYDRTSTDCQTYGCFNNSDIAGSSVYWTATFTTTEKKQAWGVSSKGKIESKNLIQEYTNVDGWNHPVGDGVQPADVRPVITLLKSKL